MQRMQRMWRLPCSYSRHLKRNRSNQETAKSVTSNREHALLFLLEMQKEKRSGLAVRGKVFMPEIAENTALFFVYSTAVLSHIPCMAYGEQNRARSR